MDIREATSADWSAIWAFMQEILRDGNTYAFPPLAAELEARRWWMEHRGGEVMVAVLDGIVVGTAELHPNQQGPGDHVANAGFMVDPQHSRRGIATALGKRVLERASELGYRAMQFNAVVETNRGAIALWRSLGFDIVGTVPDAFRRPTGATVAIHIMYREL